MKKQYILLLSATLFIFSCVKEDKRWVELPPLSGNGSNYIAFYRNGVPYIVDGKLRSPGFFSLGERTGVEYYYSTYNGDSVFFMKAVGGSEDPDFSMHIEFPFAVGTYDLNDLFKQNKLILTADFLQDAELDITKTNFISIIKSDGLAAGTFEMNLMNNRGETVKIEEGRFDIAP